MDTTADADNGTLQGRPAVVSEYIKEKDQERNVTPRPSGPLTLLELPIDILQLIVKEVTHTNDLTALALTNSALHSLAIPLIYSRFDIVWPDGQITSTESKSVDALTFGLSTLCLGSAFARTTRRAFQPGTRRLAKFKGNEYSHYIKKFSLGNGPADWVAEYMINKESGKMLGTMVALAIAKMKNLETFIWDMPTGVLSDIFMALASLAEQSEDAEQSKSECKLNRVWVRWHDNSEQPGVAAPPNGNPVAATSALVPQGSHVTAVGIMLPENAAHPPPRPPVSYSNYHCEYPTFSVLPPLKSLTVLDIDEVSYLDEMAILIERSKDTLQELRVGISTNSVNKDFAQAWDGPGLRQLDHNAQFPGASTIGERRLGGVLGVLVGKIYDIRQHRSLRTKVKPVAVDVSVTGSSTSPATPISMASSQIPPLGNSALANGTSEAIEGQNVGASDRGQGSNGRKKESLKSSKASKLNTVAKTVLDGKLKLHTLELERVALSLHVCRQAFDWTALTNLTLLDCAQHENLWKVLRKQFQPTFMNNGTSILPNGTRIAASNTPLQYHLALKSIHTDATSLALVNFIKETLAPNSLEVLFLQDRRRSSTPPIPLTEVFKGCLRRHPQSLRKLLLDSSIKPTQGPNAANNDNTRWRSWALNSEIVQYITSGRMVNLRELAVSLEYKDWHTFLQRLPNAHQLRSINIAHIADYPGGEFEPRELAHQIADIITLRPEIRLCYVGVGVKCYEMLESRDAGLSDEADFSSSGDNGTPDIMTAPSVTLNPFTGPMNGIFSNNGFNNLNGGGLATTGADPGDAEDTSEDDDGDHSTLSDEQSEAEAEEDEEDGVEEEEDDDDDDNTPTTATSDPEETEDEIDDDQTTGIGGGTATEINGNSNDNDDEVIDGYDDGWVEPGQGEVKLRLREILFYDDKVAIFKARHGKL
ncbi:hypothetical protein QBC40DRAFT_79230 [Triangularia verruculosa]|uniref:F-box domain-containing protein n=1 Tax=Triangularia verruculosa TaxID=2587418 RepID=A0AAN6XFM9_9PEZI|nr:hypothetical protein QBC40DRAFT_79230 [Triangularia verruculosa]